MLRFIARRVALLVPVLAGITVVVFTLMYLTPGDPTALMLEETATLEEREALREKLGLNDPYIVRLGNFFIDLIVRFDLGTSYISGAPVSELIASRLGATVTLAVASTVFATVVGVILGIISAARPNSRVDDVVMTLALLGVSMPNFWLGLLLMLLFSLHLGWLPAVGFSSWQHLILPVITIGTDSAAVIARMTRSSMLEVLQSSYINTARSKGVSEVFVLSKHALRTSLLPVLTAVGLQFGAMLGGALLTETIFAIPGIGKLVVDSISARDYPTLQGVVLVIALLFGLVNLIVDVLYAFVDPRLRTQFQSAKAVTR